MKHRACLGERANAYSLGKIKILEGATIAQEAYLCTGTHDFNDPSLQLITKPITIGKNAFIGARAMILPGVMHWRPGNRRGNVGGSQRCTRSSNRSG